MSSDPDSELILSANCDKSQDIWIGTAGAIMFTDDSWMLNQQENIENDDIEQDN